MTKRRECLTGHLDVFIVSVCVVQIDYIHVALVYPKRQVDVRLPKEVNWI